MKNLQIIVLTLLAAALSLAMISRADEKKTPKPYPLDTCLVTDEKIGADPAMKPYAFTHEGQEVKLCCKACLKDFNKDQAKYLKKIAAAPKKPK